MHIDIGGWLCGWGPAAHYIYCRQPKYVRVKLTCWMFICQIVPQLLHEFYTTIKQNIRFCVFGT